MAERVKVTVNLTQDDVDELKRQADKDGMRFPCQFESATGIAQCQ